MATLKPLQSVTLTSASSSVVFSNIPQDYTDLIIEVDASESTGNYVMYLEFNGDTTNNNYSDTYMLGDGSSAGSNRYNGINDIAHRFFAWGRSTARSISKIHINSYSNSTTYKTWLSRSSQLALGTSAHVGLWRSTAAITSIKFQIESSNYGAGTTFSLYGIKSGAPQALGGDLVTTDGNYWYHAFTNTGAFIPQRTLTADVLVVAGGGAGASVGGSAETGGGGGAGGFRALSSQSLSGQSYTVTVGAGGASGSNGVNSSLGSISATGGGAGGGGTGGSGGGGLSANSSQRFGGAGNAGSYSPVEGYAGGNGDSSSSSFAGGGGGAGAAGANGVSGQSGAGGIGAFTAISGGSTTALGVLSGGNYYFAGGGGGGLAGGNAAGAGGTGGGGAGSTAGTVNTGGGGGGRGSGGGSSPAGGSGIVIVRYPV